MSASLRRFCLGAVCPSLVVVLLSVPSVTYAQPAAASRGIASGELSGERLTFSWGAVPTATWYLLWIDDTSGHRHHSWYPSTYLGCDLRPLCSVSADLSLQPGEVTWWVQTYGPLGHGPWSEPQQTTMRAATQDTFSVYDSAGNRVGPALTPGSNSSLVRVEIGGRPLLFSVSRDMIQAFSAQEGRVNYTGAGCTGQALLQANQPDVTVQFMKPTTITQPGSIVWVPLDGSQPNNYSIRSYREAGNCIDVDPGGGGTTAYEAVSLGPFPYTAPFSVR